jgi:hypothetical protein
MDYESYAWVAFMTFVLLTGFITFNLVIAVVCDAVHIVSTKMEEEKVTQRQLDGTYFVQSDSALLETAQERLLDLKQHCDELLVAQEQLSLMVHALKKEVNRSSRGVNLFVDSLNRSRENIFVSQR